MAGDALVDRPGDGDRIDAAFEAGKAGEGPPARRVRSIAAFATLCGPEGEELAGLPVFARSAVGLEDEVGEGRGLLDDFFRGEVWATVARA